MDILVKARDKINNNVMKNLGHDYIVLEVHITHLVVDKEISIIQLDDTLICVNAMYGHKMDDMKYIWYDVAGYDMCRKVVIDGVVFKHNKMEDNQEVISILPFDGRFVMSNKGVIVCADRIVYSDRPKRIREYVQGLKDSGWAKIAGVIVDLLV